MTRVILAAMLALASVVEAAPPTPILALKSARSYRDHGFCFVEGQVANIGTKSLRSVVVVATWYDEGQFVKSDEALIAYDPLEPGQTSPFKSITTCDSMKRGGADVEFKTFGGPLIPHRDDRR